MSEGGSCYLLDVLLSRYLATKYGAESTLYPTDAETRAKVDQRLYFDMGVFYKVGQGKGRDSNQAEISHDYQRN